MPDITNKLDPDYERNVSVCASILSKADVLYMNSPGFMQTYEMLVGVKKVNPNLKLVGDFDDDQFNVSPYNVAYKYCGLRELKVKLDGDGSTCYISKAKAEKDTEYMWIWKNGLNDFNAKLNRKNAKATARIISMLDLMFVTTERLRFKYRKYLDPKKIVIVPNAINFEAFDKYFKYDKGDGKVHIVWPVSSSHLPDWMEIRKSLGNVLKRNKNTVLVTLGVEMGCGRDIPLSQHEHIGWAMGYAGYLYNLFTSGADIGICPLGDNRFNWKKSPIKWEEMSSMQLPTVVSKVMYGDYVKDGVTGLVYENNLDFETKLQRLIDSAELRKQIGEQAYTEVRKNYNILNVANIYESELEKLCNKIKIIEVCK